MAEAGLFRLVPGARYAFHLHEIKIGVATLPRPALVREYLGEKVVGTAQYVEVAMPDGAPILILRDDIANIVPA